MGLATGPNFPLRPPVSCLQPCGEAEPDPDPFGIRSGGFAWEAGRGGWLAGLLRGTLSGGSIGRGKGLGIGVWRIGGAVRGIDMGGMRIGGPPAWPRC